MHSQSKTERLWFSHLLESSTVPVAVDKQLKQRIHGLLARSEVFDNFLQLKFPNLKRVSFQHYFAHRSILLTLCFTVRVGRWRIDASCSGLTLFFGRSK